LQRATAAVADHATSASLYGGLTGVGWALAHLQVRLPGLDGEADAAEIDEALLHHLDRTPWPDDYDLVSGLIGFGVYALDQSPWPRPVRCWTGPCAGCRLTRVRAAFPTGPGRRLRGSPRRWRGVTATRASPRPCSGPRASWPNRPGSVRPRQSHAGPRRARPP